LTGNPSISREAGRYGGSPDAAGLIRPYILGMVDPAKAYSMVGRASGKFTRSTRFEPKRLGPNKFEIKVTPRPGVREQPFQCLNRIGFLESITAGFLNKLPKIQHPECIFRGGDCCRYIITWEKSLALIWRRMNLFVLAGLACWSLWILLFMSDLSVVSVIAPPMSVYMLFSLICVHLEKTELKTSLNHLLDSTEQLLEQINTNYNNSVITNEIGIAISGKESVAAVLKAIVQILKKRLDFDRGMILLANADKTKLHFKAGFGDSTQDQDLFNNLYFHLDKPDSRGVFISAFWEQKAFLVNDINEISQDLSQRSLSFAQTIGSKSFICCPIIGDGDTLGILAVDNLSSKRPLVETDLRLLKGIAAMLGISIKNATLIEARERQMTSMLKVLGASIDARDTMTKGHSEKVTEYAMAICDELGIESEYKEAVRIAAFLHDYGKIGVPDAVLKKPGRLTKEEILIVQTHAQKTKDILSQINFDGIFKDVPSIAGYHHEKYNGSGYPEGLKGDQIPLGARIIAVADFYEAITSLRHYRDPMGEDEAIQLLKAETRTSFDPDVVAAFLRYYQKNFAHQNDHQVLSA
jgi:HD-GYP domain-containing protein (c-di-GMP phosphodiesterase class II)